MSRSSSARSSKMPTRPKAKNTPSPRFEITNTTKGKLPRLPFAHIKNTVLGPSYDLSFVVVGDSRSRMLNKQYRGKDKPTNVLSFSLSKNEGEIIMNLKKARSEMKVFDEKFPNFVGYLFIHGLLHLKGHQHGSTMEEAERKIRRKFKL